MRIKGGLAVAVMSCLLPWVQATQQQTGHYEHNATSTVSPTIDGAIHPELISDEEAAKVLLISLMAPANATARQQAEQAAKLKPIALSAQNEHIIVTILAQFSQSFTSLMSEAHDAIQSTALSSEVKSQTVRDRITKGDHLCTITWAQILASLNPDDRVKLQRYLGDVKRHMKIIPPPVMQ